MEHDTEGLPEVLQAPSTEPGQPEQSPRKAHQVLKRVGILATGLIAGAIGIATIQGSSGSNASNASQAANSQQQGPGGRFQGGPPGGFAGGSGGAGQIAGETRVAGTLSAVGSSSITVKVGSTGDGTTITIPVNGTTEILRNGATAKLANLKTGEQVFVHVIPSGSSTVAERIFAGTIGGAGFGGPPSDQQGQPGTTSGTGTTATT